MIGTEVLEKTLGDDASKDEDVVGDLTRTSHIGQSPQRGTLGDNPQERTGIYGVGCASSPTEVSRSVKDATAAALRAIQDVRR